MAYDIEPPKPEDIPEDLEDKPEEKTECITAFLVFIDEDGGPVVVTDYLFDAYTTEREATLQDVWRASHEVSIEPSSYVIMVDTGAVENFMTGFLIIIDNDGNPVGVIDPRDASKFEPRIDDPGLVFVYRACAAIAHDVTVSMVAQQTAQVTTQFQMQMAQQMQQAQQNEQLKKQVLLDHKGGFKGKGGQRR